MTRPHRLLLAHQGLVGENHGVLVQHVLSMQWLLGISSGWEVVAMDPYHPAFSDVSLSSDVVVLHMLGRPEITRLIRLRRDRGLPTVFEVADNFVAIGEWLPARAPIRSPLVRQQMLLHAWMSDALQVYAPGLEELFQSVNRRIVRFDPYVPLAPRQPDTGRAFVVGWGGTTSHEHDLARVAPAVVDFCRSYDDVVFAFMGDRRMFERVFRDLPPERVRVRPYGDFGEYLEFVRTWHVGLAPLSASGFNAGRTDTKFATYAACGVVPVLEDGPPYDAHAAHARLFRTPADLRGILDELHRDRALLAALATRARNWAEEHRGADRLRDQRIGFYRSLVNESASVAPLPPIASPPPIAVKLAWVSVREQPQAALALADEALAECPGYAQARWIRASCLETLGRQQDALAVLSSGPWPAIYDEMVADTRHRLMRRVHPEAKIEEAALSPQAKLRMKYLGAPDRSALYRELLEHHPYDFFALSATIHAMRRESPHAPELDELYERVCLLAPDNVPPERRPARLSRFLET